MVSDRLFEKIMARLGTKEDRLKIQQVRMKALNKKLELQLEAQKMTPAVLEKYCNL